MQVRLHDQFKVTQVVLTILVILGAFYQAAQSSPQPQVIIEGTKTFIVDRTGERWDITQARSLGYQPEHFEFGLGRHAFTPLDDSLLREPPAVLPPDLRIIGTADGSQARAYSIPRLARHEVANSSIAAKPIAVAY